MAYSAHSRPQPPPALLVKRFLPDAHRNALSLLSAETLTATADLDLPAFTNDADVRLLGPCDGVLCLQGGWDGIVVWNPSTREHRSVLESPIPRPADWEPLRAVLGFGFDSRSRDFKVVRVVALYDESEMDFCCMAEVYSLKSDCWTKVGGEVFGFVLMSPHAHAYRDGVCYWLASGRGAGKLVTFNFADEAFGEIAMPPGYGNNFVATAICRDYNYAGLDEPLSVAVYVYEKKASTATTIDVWTMNGDGGNVGWTQRPSVGPLACVDTPLGFWKGGEFLLELRTGELVSYNLNTSEIKRLGVQGVPFRLQLIKYRESSVSMSEMQEFHS